MDRGAKRLKFGDSTDDALNLCLAAAVDRRQQHQPGPEDVQEMRQRFQQWVIEMYKDSSKTKTITAKKYERIIRTLVGEIRNCSENSKFRFWMKCKGFKLDTQDTGEKILLVQDKKGEEVKYKNVAVVENFFDIIYNVHVNEGARGIQHAGQKRTHRTITETYAFLPREAVTKFLLCCSECQKRSHEERKVSPNSSSCDSIHERLNSTVPTTRPPSTADRLLSNYATTNDDYPEHQYDWKPSIEPKDYDNNNYPTNYNCEQPCNLSTRSLVPDDITSAVGVRKRKRKFTRKIIRPDIESRVVESFPLEENEKAVPVSESMPRNIKWCPVNAPIISRCAYERIPSTESKSNFVKTEEEFEEKTIPESNMQNCPYISRISELFYNPAKYAKDNEKNYGARFNEDLEHIAAGVIMKARRLEAIKKTLSSDERHQLSLQVYSCRVSSFLLNYAADLMLKTAVSE